MGCFLGCFGSSKDRKRRKQRHKLHPRDHQRSTNCVPEQSTVSIVEEYQEKPIIPVSEIGVKVEEQQPSSATRKKVTFDSNVKTYEHVLPEEVSGTLPETDEGERKKEEEKSLVQSGQTQSSSEASSITSSSGSYPSNYRYQNCRESDDEEDGLGCEDSDLDDDLDVDEDEDEDGVLDYDGDIHKDDSDGIVESKFAVAKVEKEEMVASNLDKHGVKPIRSNGSARNRSAYVHSVLNPVENLTQWKALKMKGKQQLKHQKENFSFHEEPRASFSLEPSFKELSLSFKSQSDYSQSKKSNQEIAVDASLSNWLSSSEATTPINKNEMVSLNSTPEKTMSMRSNSPRSLEDRPILGALTLEEIKQFSASSSPRKSPSHDEMPIIGTVGTYWTHTGNPAKDSGSASSCKGIPNTTSKYREDKRVNWHSTPFETRLERALNRGAADAFSAHTSNMC